MTNPFDRTWADFKREELRVRLRREQDRINQELARRERTALFLIIIGSIATLLITGYALSDFYTSYQKEKTWQSKLKHQQK